MLNCGPCRADHVDCFPLHCVPQFHYVIIYTQISSFYSELIEAARLGLGLFFAFIVSFSWLLRVWLRQPVQSIVWNDSFPKLHFICQVRRQSHSRAYSLATCVTTDLHIYILDAVPPVYVAWNHVDTDKFTTANGGTLRRAQPDSVANHVKARRSLIERSVTWLAIESGWARRKRYAICSGKLCGGFIIFEQCSPCVRNLCGNKYLYAVLRMRGQWSRGFRRLISPWRPLAR